MTDETTAVAETEEAATAATAAPEQPVDQEPKPSAAEADAIRRAAEAERKAKRLEDQAKKRDEDEAAKQGEWQKLAEERAARLEQAEAKAAATEQEARIAKLAAKAKFIDPSDVVGRLTAEQAADDASAEAALEEIAERSPHLVIKDPPAAPTIGEVHSAATPAPGTPGARPAPPPGKAPLVTTADVEALSDKEFDARFAEVQAVLNNPQ